MEIKIVDINEITDKEIELVKKRFPRRFSRSNHFKIKENYLRSIGSSFLLLNLFPDITEDDIFYNQYGKPFVKNGECFNISHSADLVVGVKSSHNIGIDIEKIKDKRIEYGIKMFHKDEIPYFLENPLENFHRLWTIKESIIKFIGKGFLTKPDAYSAMPLIKEGTMKCQEYTVFNKVIRLNDYIISVTTDKIIGEIKIDFLI